MRCCDCAGYLHVLDCDHALICPHVVEVDWGEEAAESGGKHD